MAIGWTGPWRGWQRTSGVKCPRLPPLIGDGVLPPGIHRASLDEIVVEFGGANQVRRGIAERLRHILALARETGELRRVFIWGSFVTVKADPRDVDLMLVMSADFRSEQCSPPVREVFDGEAAQRSLGATVLWTREDVPAGLLNAFLDQWQLDRGGRRHGIVEVIL